MWQGGERIPVPPPPGSLADDQLSEWSSAAPKDNLVLPDIMASNMGGELSAVGQAVKSPQMKRAEERPATRSPRAADGVAAWCARLDASEEAVARGRRRGRRHLC